MSAHTFFRGAGAGVLTRSGLSDKTGTQTPMFQVAVAPMALNAWAEVARPHTMLSARDYFNSWPKLAQSMLNMCSPMRR